MKLTMLAALALALFPFPGKAANTSPTIATINDQIVDVDQPTFMELFVGDAETATTDLQLSLTSSNPTLIPADNIVFHFFINGHWFITVTPAFGLTGTATNTVTVSDGTNSAGTSFVMMVNPPPAGAARFANTNQITIPDVGTTTPHPSTINVTGMTGTITNLTVTVSKISHTYPADVHMLLVGPTNQAVVIWAKCGGGHPLTNATVTLTGAAPYPLPDQVEIWSEQLRPTDRALTNFFPQPAPAGPYGTNLAAFNGQSANGTWSLFVYDDEAPDHGNFAGGWSLMLATTGRAQPRILSLKGAGTTNVVINWSSVSNVTYRVQCQSNLNSTNWLDLVPDVTATNSTASATDNSAPSASRIYRILIP